MSEYQQTTGTGRGMPMLRALGVAALAVLLPQCSPSDTEDGAQPGVTGSDEQDAAETSEQSAGDLAQPVFDLVRISRGGTGVIAGRMTPGAEIELLANGRVISQVTADQNGEWVIILDQPLDAGAVELNLKGKAPGDGQALEAQEVVVVSVPERESDRFLEQQENGVVAVATPKEGGASRVLQRPSQTPFNGIAGGLSISTVDFGDIDTPVVSGRALPRTELRIYLDDVFQAATRTPDDGLWSVDLKATVAEGDHVLRVDQTTSDGEVQLRIEQPFSAGTPIDQSIASAGVIVRPGNSLWEIARRVYGRGTQYTVIFRENSEKILEPDLIYPGQLFRLPAGAEEG